MSEQGFSHKPVLLDECIEALAIRPEGVYLDGTLGRAGHSREIARRLAELPPYQPKVTEGYLARYARNVEPAARGAILD